ncbi:hypothetical protein [Mycobacterium talmoniae]|uniref:Uncharacterized protein n=1 Tax=Mycobacterium talmoniae TaxID=1858794 RepID=A0A1S1NJE9_9MYCO|nr:MULTISPECIES: hypothetical protein [Mycobacterium]OHV03982.1 hypothetical protein BKN37_12280 [Mycobacterium talmoniae]PQM48432.1 hypothetical protein C1Y40_01351 [Mycobacterium talmoniae]TDH57179.1 hypothetical protein E2F47_03205 [Mycobacterium eburneum]
MFNAESLVPGRVARRFDGGTPQGRYLGFQRVMALIASMLLDGSYTGEFGNETIREHPGLDPATGAAAG